MARHDPPSLYDTLEGCKRLVETQWNPVERAIGIALGSLADDDDPPPTWPEYLRRKGEKWGANPWALAQALRYLGRQSRGEGVSPLRRQDAQEGPSLPPGRIPGTGTIETPSRPVDRSRGTPGASGEEEGKS